MEDAKKILRYKSLFKTLHEWGYHFYNPSCKNVTFPGYTYNYIFKVANLELLLAQKWFSEKYKLDLSVARKTSGAFGFDIWYWKGGERGWGRRGFLFSDYDETLTLLEGFETLIKIITNNEFKPHENESINF